MPAFVRSRLFSRVSAWSDVFTRSVMSLALSAFSGTMDDRDRWQERVREIRAGGTT